MPITVTGLSFTYGKGTPYEKKALDNLDITINEGDFLGIIGHTGSGKSTFIQHLNGLIRPQEGTVEAFGVRLTPAKRPKPDLRKLRSEVGVVFQYPEYQLFEETVARDVAFGPKNMGLSAQEIDERVREAIELVGLDYEQIKDRAPFELSGGQKRRVAIAGVVAMRPKALVLDEPSAGLDPYGKRQILELIRKLKRSVSGTVVVISHDIDEISLYADRIVVFNESRIVYDLPPAELFGHAEALRAIGLDVPFPVKVADILREKNLLIEHKILTPDDLIAAVLRTYDARHGTALAAKAAQKNIENAIRNANSDGFDFFSDGETQ